MAGRDRFRGGFTLVEVLIAVAIFALVGIVSAALLSRTLDARGEARARADRLQTLQRGMQRLERDVLQFASRGVRDEFGDPRAALLLDVEGRLELTVQGWRNPLGLARSELQRVRWRLTDEGELVRTFWAVLDRAQDTAQRTQTVMSDVRAFDVEIIDGEGGSWREWPRDGTADIADPLALPDAAAAGEEGSAEYPIALRLGLEVPPFGRVERLLLVGEAIELEEDVIEAAQQAGGAVEAAPGNVPDA